MPEFADLKTRATMVQVSYDDLIVAPNNQREDLYCLTFPQTQALIAVIDIYRSITRWFYDTEVDIVAIEEFVNDTQRRLEMPCGDDNTTIIYIWNEDGELTQSTDGGVTTTPVPEKDPRNNSVVFPPPMGTQADKCVAADSAVNSIIISVFNELSADMSRADLDNLIKEWIITFLQTTNAFLALMQVIINLVFSIGAGAIISAVDSTTWEKLRCCFQEHMNDDFSFDHDGWLGLRECITTDIGGIAGIFLEHLIFLAGVTGCTNISRNGMGNENAECNCEQGCADLFYVVDPTTEISRTATSITVQAGQGGDGAYYAHITTGDKDICCDVNFDLSQFLNIAHKNCGSDDLIINTPALPWPQVWYVLKTQGTSFTVTFDLT